MEETLKNYLSPGKKNIILIYGTYLSALIIPFLPLIGAYFAFKNINNRNKFLNSHYIFAFRTFLIGTASAILLGFFSILMLIDIKFLLISSILSVITQFLAFILIIVRSIIAIQFVVENKNHPNPLTFWIK